MLVFRAGIHKMLVTIENREDPDQTASSGHSDLGLHCLSSPSWQATSVRNFRKLSNHNMPTICAFTLILILNVR